MKRVIVRLFLINILVWNISFFFSVFSQEPTFEEEKNFRKHELEELQKKFEWWPTDAQPQPVKDEERGGYWWWPKVPGKMRPWGNRGYVYVYKIIFDYKEEELPPPQPQELRPSLLIKRIIKNVKVYFDFDKAELRDDAIPILKNAVKTLNKNKEASILITGNCDRRGPEEYNLKLGRKRAEAVKEFLIENGIDEARIKIVSRGKMDALAPITDLVGMQKDRNAHFIIGEVEEVMIPAPSEVPSEAKKVEDNKFIVEEEKVVEGEVKVSTKEYIVQKGDTLSKIAQKELGGAHRWVYLYELNKDRIKDPNRLRPGQKILIPVE